MTTTHYIVGMVIPLSLALLPPQMDSPAARAMLVSIGLQESRFAHRRQIGGPARSFWQFERAGVSAVLRHQVSRPGAMGVLASMGYRPDSMTVYEAIEHNDILACCFARLLLWAHPGRLPERDEMNYGWQVYLESWRPGKPHPGSWPECFISGWGGEWPGTTRA